MTGGPPSLIVLGSKSFSEARTRGKVERSYVQPDRAFGG